MNNQSASHPQNLSEHQNQNQNQEQQQQQQPIENFQNNLELTNGFQADLANQFQHNNINININGTNSQTSPNALESDPNRNTNTNTNTNTETNFVKPYIHVDINELLLQNTEILAELTMQSKIRRNKNIVNSKMSLLINRLQRNLIKLAKCTPPACVGDPHHIENEKVRFINFYKQRSGVRR